jgi:hypothetical protein
VYQIIVLVGDFPSYLSRAGGGREGGGWLNLESFFSFFFKLKFKSRLYKLMSPFFFLLEEIYLSYSTISFIVVFPLYQTPRPPLSYHKPIPSSACPSIVVGIFSARV